ncbi:2'-5' RNA ligase family protein [Rubrobacter indicoceani]|uniref:2'-5' RNA ligase family protein n=1 Tax=Rubrobacter indicoceani TaxID=2051957 RepID=UPI000E5A9491|nr:2'-5' RNA ligase family protein [Rubrobacter indicoceani]
MTDDRPFILTLKLDERSQAFFDGMRERHFPPERNFIGAHVTLFHALQGRFTDDLASDIADAAGDHAPFAVRVKKLRSLGRGVAYVLESEELSVLRGRLAKKWRPYLTAQDAEKFSPHATVQNKVAPERAKRLLLELEATFEPFDVLAGGLLLWRYTGGPWEFVQEFGFDGGSGSRA